MPAGRTLRAAVRNSVTLYALANTLRRLDITGALTCTSCLMSLSFTGHLSKIAAVWPEPSLESEVLSHYGRPDEQEADRL
ncbi:hypothetical protein SAT01_27860 [Sinomonas atrocyanea]|nr:hypothetical protein SAT01_27860 [Sinomonas atrocyanea]GGG59107.1 hypothetical protein GCM10007172_07480 [Sinomonas atrocyanea]